MHSKHTLSRYLNIGLFLLFLLFAALQYNDPDPWLWIPIYGYAAWLCFQYSRGKRPQMATLIAILGCFVYAISLLLKDDGVVSWMQKHNAENLVQTMKATKPWIENTREFGGLLIIIIALSWNYLRACFSKPVLVR